MGNNAYTWDGANRIVNFKNNAGGTNSSFTYDGLNRLVRVIDRHNGAVTADHSYTWCGSVRCLAHDNTQSGSPVSTQYFAQGTIISGTSYYYVQDRLGSVNQLVTSSGTVVSQYTYDPYGNRTAVSGTVVPDIGYAGYFYHAASGLDFTLNRAYDPVHARWLNRDPIGEMGGINLYAYVRGNPISYIDPYGLCASNPQQDCLEHFNNSLAGNLTNVFSATSFFLGPDPVKSLLEDYGSLGKYALEQGLTTVTAEATLAIEAASAAEALTLIGTAALPAVGIATLTQIVVHIDCALSN